MSHARILDRRRRAAGFTIIEVLVALAVVAASLAAIGSLVAATVRGSRMIEQHTELVETARAIEAGLPGRDRLAVDEPAGEVAGHRWRVEVSPYSAAPAAGRAAWLPHSVVITVRASTGARLRIDTVRLLRGTDG